MNLALMMVILIGLTLAFALGWLRGRRDLTADMEPMLDELEGAVLLARAAKKPACKNCGHVEPAEEHS